MMFSPHPAHFPIEPGETVLWRYVDLYRLLDLLRTGELHLTRADQMEDRWEGAPSAASIAARPHEFDGNNGIIDDLPHQYELMRRKTYLNCWYADPGESYAMWRLYDTAGKGVAVRTTAQRLHDALDGQWFVTGSRVRYENYETAVIPESDLMAPYYFKRRSFDFEREYRLAANWWPPSGVMSFDRETDPVMDEGPTPAFLRERVDLQRLIHSVYVAPNAPRWAAVTVSDVVDRYLPGTLVVHSDLNSDPVY